MVAEAAHNLSQYYHASITFTQFVNNTVPQSEVLQSQTYLENIQDLCESDSDTLLLRGSSEIETVVEATEAYDLLVIGARPHNKLSNIFFKTWEDHLLAKAVCSVLLLKSPRIGPRTHRAKQTRPDLTQYLNPQLVGWDTRVTNKVELLKLCAQKFAKQSSCVSEEDVFDALIKRENAQNTGVCHGVAMPHATIPELHQSHLLVEVLGNALEYGAPDNKPVDVDNIPRCSKSLNNKTILQKQTRAYKHPTCFRFYGDFC